MKKVFFLTLIAFLFIGLGNVDAQYGNTKKKKKKKKPKTERSREDTRNKDAIVKRGEETRKFTDDLWYGVNIGNVQFGTGFFSLGASPMAGYRLFDQFSLGALVKLDYVYIRGFNSRGEVYRYGNLDIGPTVFARYKFLDQFFGQVEYERASFQRAQPGVGGPAIIDGKVQKERYGEDYVYVGVGYGGGFPFSTYVSLHYNILDDIRATRIPWDYRIGLTWNF